MAAPLSKKAIALAQKRERERMQDEADELALQMAAIDIAAPAASTMELSLNKDLALIHAAVSAELLGEGFDEGGVAEMLYDAADLLDV